MTAAAGHAGSSVSGRKRTDGQRLSLRLAALCAPSTIQLNVVSRHIGKPGRALLDALFPIVGFTSRADATVTPLTVDGAAGPLDARLYEPPAAEAGGGLLVYFHGGGFILGSIASHDMTCRFTARTSGCKVLSVGYRKAPEHPFPAAFDDARAAFRWAVAQAGEFGVPADQIAVGGDSAGGQLAAAVALHTDGGPRPAFAFLIYPLVDADIDAYASARLFARGPLLSRRSVTDMLNHYLPAGVERSDPRISVAHAGGLDRLPPTFIATAGMDPLRDQGEAFARTLLDAGVAVTTERFRDLPHGFNLLLIDPQARQAWTRCCLVLRAALAAGQPSPPGGAATVGSVEQKGTP